MKKAKRLLALVLCAAMLLGIVPFAQANSEDGLPYPVEGGNIYFNDESGLIIGCSPEATYVTIPDEINGAAVVGIDAYAFRDCTKLTGMTIGSGLESIDRYAFLDCCIMNGIFVDEGNPNFSSDEMGVLYDEEFTELLYFPRGYEGSYEIVQTVTGICDSAFENCAALTQIVIPESVTNIAARAFYGCTALENISLPDSVSLIGALAFRDTADFNDPANWENDLFYIGNHLIEANLSVSGECIINDGTLTIAEQAFFGCEDLTSVTLPDSIESISSYAFCECYGLESIMLGSGITTIADYAFSFCEALTSISLPSCIESIGIYAFDACDSLAEVFYDGSEEMWSRIAIDEGNDSLLNATIHFGEQSGELPDGPSVELPEEPLEPEEGTIAYPVVGGNIYIREDSGRICGCDPMVTEASIPSEIGGIAVTGIETEAFAGRTRLVSVTIPACVGAIEDFAFVNCSALTDLTIEDGVKNIGRGAFKGCASLTEVTIPKSVEYIAHEVFARCVKLTSLIVDEENEYYTVDEDNVLYNKDKTELIAFPASYEGAYTVAESVTFIGMSAFEGCEGLTEITLHEGVTSIDNGAFSYCVNLIDVVLPYGLESIGPGAFMYAENLENVSISESVIEIGDMAFASCTALADITIPESVEYIGESAFEACGGLETITILNPECEIYPSSKTLGIRNMTMLFGRKDSTAQAYAKEFGYSFAIIICDEHNLQFVEAREVDCTRDGCIAHWYCDDCVRYFGDEAAMQELAFDDVFTPREEHVYGEDDKCTVCGCGLPFVIDMLDSCGDGWSYSSIMVYEDGRLIAELSIKSGAEATATVDYYEDREYYFAWSEGAWTDECSFTITRGDETLYVCENASTLFDKETFFAICEHDWLDATCEEAKTCAKCNMKDGEAPGHDYDAVVKEATCTEEGYTTYTCTVCGDSYTDDYQLPSDHSYVEVVTEPTCSEIGYTTYTCSACGDSYVDNEVPPAHQLVDNVCIICGAVSPILVEMNDKWGDGWNGNTLLVYENGELIEELTIGDGSAITASIDYDSESEYYFVWSQGVCTEECSFKIILAGETLYEIDNAASLTDGQTVFAICEHHWIDASCEAPKTCEKCNMTEGESLEHNYNEDDVCTVCGEYVPIVVHMTDIWGNGWNGNTLCVYENGELIKELTFEAGTEASEIIAYHPDNEYFFVWIEGANADECAFEIMRKDEVLFEAENASMFADGETVFAICNHVWIEAGCENPQTCEKCNLIVGTANGHSYTYTPDNEAAHKIGCENCDYSELEFHDFVDGECVCGLRENNDPSLNKNLKFNMNIAIGAEMVVNYNFAANVVSSYADFYLEVKKNVAGGEPVVTTYGIGEEHVAMGVMNHPVTGEAVLYNASYNGINAKEMGDSFETTLYAVADDGKVYCSETVVSSIREFLMGKLVDEKSARELKTMAVDMLIYGAAAQRHFAYDTENLVTDELTEEQLAYATQEIPEAVDYQVVSGDGSNVTTSIMVGSKVELSLSAIVRDLADPSAVKCVITDEDGKILAELATGCMANVMFTAKYDNVGAREMRKMICATFYDAAGNAISKTLKWSVESYVAQTRASAKAGETEIDMVNTMLAYGDSVGAYLTAIGQ